MGAPSFLPIDNNSDRNQNAPRLKQTRDGSNNLPPHPFEQICLRGLPASDATADVQETHADLANFT